MDRQFQDQIPEMVSESLPSIFLGDLEGNLEAGNVSVVAERRFGKRDAVVALIQVISVPLNLQA